MTGLSVMSVNGGKADEIDGKAGIRHSALTRQNSDCDDDAVSLKAGDTGGSAMWRKIIKAIEVLQATEPGGASHRAIFRRHLV